jgi:hypothetical protein
VSSNHRNADYWIVQLLSDGSEGVELADSKNSEQKNVGDCSTLDLGIGFLVLAGLVLIIKKQPVEWALFIVFNIIWRVQIFLLSRNFESPE